jgi:FkbM family methyltransferase
MAGLYSNIYPTAHSGRFASHLSRGLELRDPRGPAENVGSMFTRLRYLYRACRYRLRVDPAELRFVIDSLRPGQVAVDIGCHKGAYTYWMRRSVGPSGAVYAFEPQPGQVAYLREAFSAMRYDNVEIVPLAVSDRCGEMPLYVPAIGARTHEASLELSVGARNDSGPRNNGFHTVAAPQTTPTYGTLHVNVTTLDDFFAGRPHGPNFVKIDVEGHELAVLQGATRTLKQHRPAILVECEARHRPDHDVWPVFDFLESLGYTGSFFSNRTRRPLVEFDPAVHQRLDLANPEWLPRGYVNNFAFV